MREEEKGIGLCVGLRRLSDPENDVSLGLGSFGPQNKRGTDSRAL